LYALQTSRSTSLCEFQWNIWVAGGVEVNQSWASILMDLGTADACMFYVHVLTRTEFHLDFSTVQWNHGQLLHLIWYTAHMFSQHDGCNGRTFSEHGHASYVKVLWYLTNVQFPAAKRQPGTVLPQKRHGWPGDPTWKSSARKPNLQLPPGRALETSGDIWRLDLWRTISPSNPSWPRCGVEIQHNWFRPQRCCWYASLCR